MKILKSILILVIVSLANFYFTRGVYATSGACSGHGGVDCSSGADSDGSVVCIDGWRDSSVSYSSMSMCASLTTSASAIKETCYNHGGLACNRISFDTDNALCYDYSDSGVSYIDACTHSTQDLIYYFATTKCKDVINAGVAAGVATLGGSCIADKQLEFGKQFFPNCKEAVVVVGSSGSCVTYAQFCSPDSAHSWQKQVSACDRLLLSTESSNSSSVLGAESTSLVGTFNPLKKDAALIKKLSGNILLQVESHGEAWYLDPVTLKRYYMKDGAVAYEMMRSFGLGVSESDYDKINSGDVNLLTRLRGKIVLRPQAHGEAYYIHPKDLSVHYLQNGDEAYRVMRLQSLGITNVDLEKIPTGAS